MITLPDKVQQIIETLTGAGYEAYAVGGCVRDVLLGRKPDDWDITTSAKPEQVKALFRRTVDTGIKHGTVTVLFGKDGFEVTTYRVDGIYEDSRHPKSVTFTNTLEEDLKRRDFTINAMAYNPDTGLVDLFRGMQDMELKVIRAVGEPRERFSEDALRILRALRFSAQLDYSIEDKTSAAIVALKDNLRQISAERIRTELQKLLLSDHPEKMQELYRLGITAVVLPEYDHLDDEQREEVCQNLCRAERDPVIRLSILLLYADAQAVLKRLKYDNETIRRVQILVDNADRQIEPTPYQVRKSIVETGNDLIPSLLSMKRSVCHQDPASIDAYERLYHKILNDRDCISMKDLAVCGNDLMAELKMKPGKELGDTLKKLFEKVLEDPSLNEKEKLLSLLKNGELFT